MWFFAGVVGFLVLCVLVIDNRISDKTYIAKFMLYLDIFVCAAVFMDPAITISSRCGLALLYPEDSRLLLRSLGRVLNLIQKDHCNLAIAHDLGRDQRAIQQLLGKTKALRAPSAAENHGTDPKSKR